jgi:acetyl esterase/lipase
MSFAMPVVWIYFLLRKKLGLAKIGRPPRAPARPSSKQLQGLTQSLEVIDGFNLYRIRPEKFIQTVVYLHGGGYVQPIAKQHWDLITHLARETNSEFVVPCYGLSPKFKVDDALTFLERVKGKLDSSKKIVLMGDSAGGGLALALAQSSWPDIQSLVLISPWVDSEFGEETKMYEERDPWLNANSLRYIATIWSGVGDFRRKEVSPLRGELKTLPRTSIYAGDYELFYPDLQQLYSKMKDAGVSVTLHHQPGGLHVYPLIPSPEGNRALNQLAIDLLAK